jgi:hypothetical protein
MSVYTFPEHERFVDREAEQEAAPRALTRHWSGRFGGRPDRGVV